MTTILYVEDHPPAQLLMQAIIGDLTDYQLLIASTGAEALTMTEVKRPDLYLLDVDLPDMGGLVLAKSLAEKHKAPIILVSAYAEAIHPDDVYDYLPKPLDPYHVAETLRRALAGR